MSRGTIRPGPPARLDDDTSPAPASSGGPPAAVHRSAWLIGLPFLAVHVACIGVVWVGWSWTALGLALVLYLARMFGITAFYHRCLAHRAFRVSRGVQLAGTLLATAAAQRGPLWWTAHHRRHHRYVDRPGDVHSPRDGLAWSHVLWIFDDAHARTDTELVADLARFPELRFLDRLPHLVPALLAMATFGLGSLLGSVAPGLHTSGPQLLVWGFCISTVALWHATFSVNSACHMVGRRRFDTPDTSRNTWWVAALTLGEGWHNNHHRYPRSARSGISGWEIDPTWLGVRTLAALGLARNLVGLPERVLATERPRSARGAARRADGWAAGPGSPLSPSGGALEDSR